MFSVRFGWERREAEKRGKFKGGAEPTTMGKGKAGSHLTKKKSWRGRSVPERKSWDHGGT